MGDGTLDARSYVGTTMRLRTRWIWWRYRRAQRTLAAIDRKFNELQRARLRRGGIIGNVTGIGGWVRIEPGEMIIEIPRGKPR